MIFMIVILVAIQSPIQITVCIIGEKTRKTAIFTEKTHKVGVSAISNPNILWYNGSVCGRAGDTSSGTGVPPSPRGEGFLTRINYK